MKNMYYVNRTVLDYEKKNVSKSIYFTIIFFILNKSSNLRGQAWVKV